MSTVLRSNLMRHVSVMSLVMTSTRWELATHCWLHCCFGTCCLPPQWCHTNMVAKGEGRMLVEWEWKECYYNCFFNCNKLPSYTATRAWHTRCFPHATHGAWMNCARCINWYVTSSRYRILHYFSTKLFVHDNKQQYFDVVYYLSAIIFSFLFFFFLF